jgi:dihydrofolate reductase
LDDNDPVVTSQMNRLPKLVFSRTLKKTPWGKWDNASVSADPVATVKAAKANTGGDMVIFGSGGLVSALAPHGLIDEYRFIVNPSILGQGAPMFRGIPRRINLKLQGSRRFDSDVVMLSYRPETN